MYFVNILYLYLSEPIRSHYFRRGGGKRSRAPKGGFIKKQSKQISLMEGGVLKGQAKQSPLREEGQAKPLNKIFC